MIYFFVEEKKLKQNKLPTPPKKANSETTKTKRKIKSPQTTLKNPNPFEPLTSLNLFFQRNISHRNKGKILDYSTARTSD